MGPVLLDVLHTDRMAVQVQEVPEGAVRGQVFGLLVQKETMKKSTKMKTFKNTS